MNWLHENDKTCWWIQYIQVCHFDLYYNGLIARPITLIDLKGSISDVWFIWCYRIKRLIKKLLPKFTVPFIWMHVAPYTLLFNSWCDWTRATLFWASKHINQHNSQILYGHSHNCEHRNYFTDLCSLCVVNLSIQHFD